MVPVRRSTPGSRVSSVLGDCQTLYPWFSSVFCPWCLSDALPLVLECPLSSVSVRRSALLSSVLCPWCLSDVLPCSRVFSVLSACQTLCPWFSSVLCPPFVGHVLQGILRMGAREYTCLILLVWKSLYSTLTLNQLLGGLILGWKQLCLRTLKEFLHCLTSGVARQNL